MSTEFESSEEHDSFLGTYGNIRDEESSVVSCSDSLFARYSDPGWWRSYCLCIEDNGCTLLLESFDRKHTIEIRRQDYVCLGTPAFHVGDAVTVKRSGKSATVVGVDWHDRRNAFRYTLDYGNRVSTNWFFDGDVERA